MKGTLSLAVIALLFFTGTCLGGFNLSSSEQNGSQNLTMDSFNALGISGGDEAAIEETGAPTAVASSAGTELAAYSEQAPVDYSGELLSADLEESQPSYVYYDGSYVGWTDFTSTIPSNFAGMWIERSAGWSWYATMPRGMWARELLYVPSATYAYLYEVYPGGYVRGYDLGFVQAGYYYIWFYADVPGRHRCLFTTQNGYSNTVVIDVYSISIPYTPVRPSQREVCEQNPQCSWSNGHCYCRGIIDDPKKLECEQNPQCDYVNGHCYCRGIIDDPKEECEQNPQCDYVNGHCYCRGVIDDPKEECEQNSLCHYVDGNCYCTGANPEPEPDPAAECEQNSLCHYVDGNCYCTGENPEPEPQPEPEPGPVPNPVAECEQNPTCHYVDGNCYCTGAGLGAESDSGDVDDSEAGASVQSGSA